MILYVISLVTTEILASNFLVFSPEIKTKHKSLQHVSVECKNENQ